MTPTSTTPCLAHDLARIHKVITRGLEVSRRYAAQYAEKGCPDSHTQQGFVDYVRSLTSVLGAHHLGEEEVAFPSLRLKLPGAPYDQLAAEHQAIEKIIDQVKSTIEDVATGTSRTKLVKLTGLLTEISRLWPSHFQMEERNFTEAAIAAVMDPGEQGRLSGSLAKHSQEHATPGPLAVPFVLFNLDAEDRAAMMQAMPQVVVEQLVPIVWKDQWAPMKPFLLE